MNDIMALVSDFLAGLESREKRALKIGALILSAVSIFMLLLPKWETYSLAKEHRDRLQADVVWLQEKRDIVADLVNNCPAVRQQKNDFKADLSYLVSRNQLRVMSLKEKENSISLSVSGSKSNNFIKLMHQIACRGYILGELAIDTEADDLSKITATFEVERVN